VDGVNPSYVDGHVRFARQSPPRVIRDWKPFKSLSSSDIYFYFY